MIKRFGAIDGLRTIACIGIVMMHIQTKNQYEMEGFISNRVIPSFTNFVFLFMVLSSFGMCVGYYDKMITGKQNLTVFYKKRYFKIIPFFSILVLIDFLRSPSISSFYEVVADLSLMFGLFNNNITVLGVGWFLGLIFAFYLLFPFFCTLLESKKRAWVCFSIAIVMNYICGSYFQIGRQNIVYCMCYFLLGGLIYLYREPLECFSADHQIICLLLLCVSVACYYQVGTSTITIMSVAALLLVYAIGRSGGLLDNRVTKWISSISMEIYLSHMAVFQVVKQLKINTRFGNGVFQYLITVATVLVGAACFSFVMQKSIEYVIDKLERKAKINVN